MRQRRRRGLPKWRKWLRVESGNKLERDRCCGSWKGAGEKTRGRARYVSLLRLSLCTYTRRAFRTVNFFGEFLASRKFLGLHPLRAVRIPSLRCRRERCNRWHVSYRIYFLYMSTARCDYQSKQWFNTFTFFFYCVTQISIKIFCLVFHTIT